MPPPVTFDDVRARAGELPGTEEGLCFGTPAIRVKGKFFLRLELADLLEMGWRFVAPQRLLAAFEAAKG